MGARLFTSIQHDLPALMSVALPGFQISGGSFSKFQVQISVIQNSNQCIISICLSWYVWTISMDSNHWMVFLPSSTSTSNVIQCHHSHHTIFFVPPHAWPSWRFLCSLDLQAEHISTCHCGRSLSRHWTHGQARQADAFELPVVCMCKWSSYSHWSWYPLVNRQKTMENHHFNCGKSTISMGHFQ